VRSSDETIAKDRGAGAKDGGHSRLTKGCCYYSDCRPEPVILETVRRQLDRVRPGPIYSVTLAQVSLPDGWRGHVLEQERGYLTMFRQILAGLERLDTDYAFLVEHDVLYHPSHFDFTPPTKDKVFYNQNVWKLCAETGRALHYLCSQTSGLCAARELLIEHYRKRVVAVEANGFSRRNGFEPGTRQLRHGGFDDLGHDVWMSAAPNIDIRHDKNLTQNRWRKDQFRDQKYTAGWTESGVIPSWGQTIGRFPEFLQEVKIGEAPVSVAA
jgi:hypothetical protein